MITRAEEHEGMSVHIGAQPGEIAERVLLPGDPMRAKWIAETFLEDAVCYTEVRGMLGFTGTWQGVRGLGAGLRHGHAVGLHLHPRADQRVRREVADPDRLVRRPGRGPAARRRGRGDRLVHRLEHEPDPLRRPVDYAPVADFGLLRTAVDVAERRGTAMRVGPILAADAFYTDRPDLYDSLADYGVLAVEMESAAIYTIAARYRARALTILTVSDHIKTGDKMDSAQRELGFGAHGQDRLGDRDRRRGVSSLPRRCAG